MSDTFRTVFPIPVTMSPGELPTSTKISSLSSQTRNGLGIIERALGDVWNQSGDAAVIPTGDLFKNALYVSSIARALGTQKLTSPQVPYLPNLDYYRDSVTNSPAKPEFYLRYLPDATPGYVVHSVSPDGAVVVGQLKTNIEDVDADGDWYVSDVGKVTTFTTVSGLDLEYKPTPFTDVDTQAQFNVVPDPNSDTGTYGTEFMGLKLAYANDTNDTDGYWLYLPPRKPLVAGRTIASSPNPSNNQVDPSGGDSAFFQDTSGTYDAGGAHFRYEFCKIVQDLVDAAQGPPAADTDIPDNLLFLYDSDTGTFMDGLSFEVDSSAPLYAVKVTGTKLDSVVAADPTIGGTIMSSQADEDDTAYKDRFVLVMPSTSLADYAEATNRALWNHTHTAFDGTVPLSHTDLIDLYNSNSPDWNPSALDGDDHPQYLHRDGYDGTAVPGGRDMYSGGMRGSILMLSTDAASNYFNLAADSRKIYFGTEDMSLFYDFSATALTLSSTEKVQISATDDVNLASEDGIYVDASGSNTGTVYFPSGSTETDVKIDRDIMAALSAQKLYVDVRGGDHTYSNPGPGTDAIDEVFATLSGVVVPVGVTACRMQLTFTGHFHMQAEGIIGAKFYIKRTDGSTFKHEYPDDANLRIVADTADYAGSPFAPMLGSHILSYSVAFGMHSGADAPFTPGTYEFEAGITGTAVNGAAFKFQADTQFTAQLYFEF